MKIQYPYLLGSSFVFFVGACIAQDSTTSLNQQNKMMLPPLAPPPPTIPNPMSDADPRNLSFDHVVHKKKKQKQKKDSLIYITPQKNSTTNAIDNAIENNDKNDSNHEEVYQNTKDEPHMIVEDLPASEQYTQTPLYGSALNNLPTATTNSSPSLQEKPSVPVMDNQSNVNITAKNITENATTATTQVPQPQEPQTVSNLPVTYAPLPVIPKDLNKLDKVTFEINKQKHVIITVFFEKNITMPNSFITDEPVYLSIDFPDTILNNVKKGILVEEGDVKQIRLAQANNKTRLVVDLLDTPTYNIIPYKQKLIVDITPPPKEPTVNTQPTVLPLEASNPVPSVAVSQKQANGQPVPINPSPTPVIQTPIPVQSPVIVQNATEPKITPPPVSIQPSVESSHQAVSPLSPSSTPVVSDTGVNPVQTEPFVVTQDKKGPANDKPVRVEKEDLSPPPVQTLVQAPSTPKAPQNPVPFNDGKNIIMLLPDQDTSVPDEIKLFDNPPKEVRHY